MRQQASLTICWLLEGDVAQKKGLHFMMSMEHLYVRKMPRNPRSRNLEVTGPP
jgi:hypothetical protein